eukprot:CAMPEP_0114581122 /NCGR_PEP_ID=MMETSP0125-20121206/5261_1 /TAXON_ID=485358 ORGANISM="Aristerostoma sp., Strain ATCC 50986" /NCGR_SAMPLE_ID=MMETSP0125 /ASSEMBLY_ACC=CAM_ASM_000245 /LENGTH=395 /DNA_ID=CAMNT_0001773075 /DNA_START=86 /DNA_END=1276 /DNA_ORIENTATION=+
MSSTAHKSKEEKKEYFDPEEELDKKAKVLAEQIRNSKHFVAFTGAGISTSAGIADFRSGVDTKLATGPGAWEKKATGYNKKPAVSKPMHSAIPTPTHMALVALERAGYLKYLISQNVDGLHRKSGFPSRKLAELHGNTNLEVCRSKGCGKQYLRDFRTRTAQKVHDHQTSRKCENCGGKLYDSIINFGENLPEYELTEGFRQSEKSDLMLCLGSSLRVTPAADMPLETARNKGQLVIVNLQSTPLDKYSTRINGFIDNVMIKVMKYLDLEIPEFSLKRRLNITKSYDQTKKVSTLKLRGVDDKGDPYQVFKSIEVKLADSKENFTSDKDPMVVKPKSDLQKGKMTMKFGFHGHYSECPFEVDIDLDRILWEQPNYFMLEYSVKTGKWIKFEETHI